MKFVQIVFLAIVILGSLNFTEAIPGRPFVIKQNKVADWTELFPEIPHCERVMQPLTQNGEIFEQTAIYEQENYKDYKGGNYTACGSITLRFEPAAKKSARQKDDVGKFPRNQPVKIKDFEAYHSSPQCGNDPWIGSTAVYFDEDKVLTVSANMGAGVILDFAQTANYDLIKKSLNKTVKIGNRQE